MIAVLTLAASPLVGCAPDPYDGPVAAGVGATESNGLQVIDRRGQEQVEIVALDNVFVDGAIRVDVGTRVVWHNDGRSKHSIVSSSDGAPADLSIAAIPAGSEHATTFDTEGEFTYFCHLHGDSERGMLGVVVVGDPPVTTSNVSANATAAPSPPTVEEPEETPVDPGLTSTIRVPSDAPTIQAAVDRATPGALVLIASGTYHEAVVVKVDDIHIRGESRNQVVLDGGFVLDNGVEVLEADGVTIENLTVTRYTTNGLFWTGVRGYRASYITSINNGYYGIYAFNSSDGIFEHSYASGSADAGFYIGQCTACDAVVDDVVSEYNSFGYSGVNTGGIVIEHSVWRHNRAGIVIGSLDNELLAPERDTVVRHNVVEDNGDPMATAPANPDLDAVFGIGIGLLGGLDNTVTGNQVHGNARIGIAIAPNPAIQINFWPAERNNVTGNVVSGSGEYDLAIAAIPELAGNCFEDNEFATSGPLSIEQAAPCTGAATADLAAGAPDLARYLDTSGNPPGVRYQDQPSPGSQPEMPDPLTAVPVPTSERER